MNTVSAKTCAKPLSLLHGPCSWPVCGRLDSHASLARSVLKTRAAPFLLLPGALLTHGRSSSPRTQLQLHQNPITVKITPTLPQILLKSSPKTLVKAQSAPVLLIVRSLSQISDPHFQIFTDTIQNHIILLWGINWTRQRDVKKDLNWWWWLLTENEGITRDREG